MRADRSHEVRLSRVYFVADRRFTNRVGKMKFFRYPLSKYFPKSALRAETLVKEAEEEFEEDFGQGVE